MTKSRLFLRNSARAALNSILLIIFFSFLGCSSSAAPTYIKENIDKAIQDICKKEYKLDVKSKLIGKTAWVYFPVEGLLEKSDKPQKYTEKFSIEANDAKFVADILKAEYSIKKIPDEEKMQEYKFNKEVLEKNNNVWKAIRRVIFSMESTKEGSGPIFVCLVTADIQSGLVIKDIAYITDLKKVSYGFIPWTEYQHRAIQDVGISPAAIGDKTGAHIDYKDITMEDFISLQIQQRIKLKFQKAEVDKNYDMDQEVLKVVIYTIKTYGFKNFSEVQISNLLTNNTVVLNRAALWARPTE